MIPKFVIHLFSGGLDSTVLLYDLLKQGCQVHCLLFDYGQKHRRELSMAVGHCERWQQIPRSRLEIPPLMGSKLTDGKASSVVVPNRNAVMLSYAVSMASAIRADCVTYACNADDAAEFPDCRPEFVAALNAAVKAAELKVEICAPYIGLTKKQIVEIGRGLGVKFENTYSCYEGGFEPCGKCQACEKRKAALA